MVKLQLDSSIFKDIPIIEEFHQFNKWWKIIEGILNVPTSKQEVQKKNKRQP